jgi:hypothetical protein
MLAALERMQLVLEYRGQRQRLFDQLVALEHSSVARPAAQATGWPE